MIEGQAPAPLQPQQPPASRPAALTPSERIIALPYTLLFTIPETLALIPRVGATLTNRKVVQTVSGLTWATAGAVQKLCQFLRWTTEKANNEALIRAGGDLANIASRETLERFRDVRQLRGDQAQAALEASEIVSRRLLGLASFIPVIGPYIAKPAEIASDVGHAGAKLSERAIRAAELANAKAWSKMLPELIRSIQILSPSLLSVMGYALSKGEKGAEWLKTIAAEALEHPEVFEEALINIADRLDATAWKLENIFSEEGGVTKADMKAFNELPEAEQNDIRFLVQESGIKDLKSDEELVKAFKALPKSEKEKITPRLFENYDEFTKIQCVHLVREYAKTLSPEERKTLLSAAYRRVNSEGDFEKLTIAKKKELQDIVVRHFNLLDPEIQDKLYNLSIAQYSSLRKEDQHLLFKHVYDQVTARGTKHEKERFDALQKKCSMENPLSSVRDIKSLLNAFQKHLTTREKIFFCNSLNQKFLILKLSPQELDMMIKNLEKEIVELNDDKLVKADKLLQVLKSQQRELARELERGEQVAHPKGVAIAAVEEKAIQKASKSVAAVMTPTKAEEVETVRLAHIQAAVGPHNVSGKAFYGSLYAVGFIPRGVLYAAGGAGFLVSRALAYLSEPYIPIHLLPITSPVMRAIVLNKEGYLKGSDKGVVRIESTMKAAAANIEYATLIPGFYSYLGSRLQSLGFPLHTIDRMIATLPIKVIELVLGASGKAIDGLSYSINLADSVQQIQSDLRGAETVTAAKEALLVLTPKAERSAEELKALIKVTCSRPPERLFCSPEAIPYLTNPLKLKELATSLQVQENSPELFAAITSVIQTGQIPQVAPQVGDEVSRAIVTAIASGGNTVSRHFVEVASSMRGLLTNASQTNIPLDLQEKFSRMIALHALVTNAKAKMEMCTKASLAIEELNSSYLGAMKLLVARAPLPEGVMDAMSSTYNQIAPALKSAVSALNVMQTAALASKDALAMSLKLQRTIEEDLDAFFQKQREQAEGILQDESSSPYKKAIYNGISTVLDITAIGLAVGGATSIALPFLMTRVIPPLLRAGAPIVGAQAKPFWYGLASASLALGDTTGKKVQELLATPGSFAQRVLNVAISGWSYVDPQRVENFYKKLSKDEQQHLLDFVTHSNQLSSQESTRFTALQAINPYMLSKEERDELATLALKNFDRQSKFQLLNITPTYFHLLNAKTKERIIDIVEKYDPLAKSEQNSVEALVKKFNGLTGEQKKEIDDFTIWDYGALTIDSQEDIRFFLANSESYKGHIKAYIEQVKDQSFKALEKKFGTFAAAWEEHDRVAPEDRMSWTHEQFQQISKMSNSELRELLPLLGKLKDSEKSLLTPSRLRSMSPAKIRHAYSILNDHHPEYIEEFRKASPQKINLRLLEASLKTGKPHKYLLEALAVLFNKLPASQRKELLNLTKEEFQAFSPEEKKHVLYDLLNRDELTTNKEELQQELVKLGQGKEVDSTKIARAFNKMKLSSQVECREMKDSGVKQKEAVEHGLNEELETITYRLRHLEKKRKRLAEVEYFAYEKKAETDANTKTKFDKVVADLKHLDEAITADRLKKQALERLLGKETHKLDEFEEELPTVEQKAIEAAWLSAVDVVAKTREQVLMEAIDANAFDTHLLEAASTDAIQKLNFEIGKFREKKEAAIVLIEKLKAEIRAEKNASYEIQIKRQEKIRLLRTFSLPLCTTIIERYTLIVTTAEKKIKDIEKRLREDPNWKQSAMKQSRAAALQFRIKTPDKHE